MSDKLKKFAGELNLNKKSIQYSSYNRSTIFEPDIPFVRIFLTLKRHAIVEVSFEDEASLTLWSYDIFEGGITDDGNYCKTHTNYPKLAIRGKITIEEEKLGGMGQLPTMGSYLTQTERAVFKLVTSHFFKYAKSNPIRFILES